MPARRFPSFFSYLLIVVPFGCASHALTTPLSAPDRILIVKSTRTLSLMKGSQALKSYKVALGTEPVGGKVRQDDHKTPEAQYIVDRDRRNLSDR